MSLSSVSGATTPGRRKSGGAPCRHRRAYRAFRLLPSIQFQASPLRGSRFVTGARKWASRQTSPLRGSRGVRVVQAWPANQTSPTRGSRTSRSARAPFPERGSIGGSLLPPRRDRRKLSFRRPRICPYGMALDTHSYGSLWNVYSHIRHRCGHSCRATRCPVLHPNRGLTAACRRRSSRALP